MRIFFLYKIVPLRRDFSRFNTWKFYFNLGETCTSKELCLRNPFHVSTLGSFISISVKRVLSRRSLFLHFNFGEVKSRRAVVTLQLLAKCASEEGFYFVYISTLVK